MSFDSYMILFVIWLLFITISLVFVVELLFGLISALIKSAEINEQNKMSNIKYFMKYSFNQCFNNLFINIRKLLIVYRIYTISSFGKVFCSFPVISPLSFNLFTKIIIVIIIKGIEAINDMIINGSVDNLNQSKIT